MLDFIILALATWRLASFLVYENGPFEVFARTRHLLGVRYDDSSMAYGANWLAKGVICLPCASVWFGFFWSILFFFWPGCVWLALPFALSAGAILMEKLTDG